MLTVRSSVHSSLSLSLKKMASRKALVASLFGLNVLIERGYAFVSPSLLDKKALLSTPRKLEVR